MSLQREERPLIALAPEAHPRFAAETVSELIARVKADPGKFRP
jgi:hypothetical protein